VSTPDTRLERDDELMRDAIRMRRGSACDRVFARTVTWSGPHRPRSAWRLAASIPAAATDEELIRLAQSVLQDPKYFAVCPECGQRQLLGWMHEGRFCRSCAQFNHGIVY